jgi:hypothetical protein
MMRRSCSFLVAAAACFPLGCGSEVGDGYTGEVLLDFHGSVTSDAPIPDGSVLVLTYPTAQGVLLIDGVIEGEFPSAFRFSTTKLPPQTEEMDFAGNGKLVKTASFGLAAVQANHPAMAHEVFTNYATGDWYPDPTQVPVTRTYRTDDGLGACTGGTGCYTQNLTCQVSPCQLLDSDGDAAIKQQQLFTQAVADNWGPRDDGYYSWSITCDPFAADKCYRDEYRCGTSTLGKNDFVYWLNNIFTCTVNQESGDPTLLDQSLTTSVKANFGIVWVSEDVESDFGLLKAGYNIVQYQSSIAAWLDSSKCVEARMLAAMAAYNAAHGTHYPPFIDSLFTGNSPPDPDPVARQEIANLTNPIFAQCAREAGAGVVPDPTKQDLVIEIVHTAKVATQ